MNQAAYQYLLYVKGIWESIMIIRSWVLAVSRFRLVVLIQNVCIVSFIGYCTPYFLVILDHSLKCGSKGDQCASINITQTQT